MVKNFKLNLFKKLPFNKAIRILLLTNALILISGYMLGPIYALYVEEIGGDLLDASLATAIFAFAAGLTTLFAGRYVDKIKEDELIIVFGYAVIAVTYILYNFVGSIASLFAVEVVLGFGSAIYSPAFDALYTNHTCKSKVGREWGSWESMSYFMAALGTTVGGIIVVNFGFHAIFILMAILSAASAVYIYQLPRDAL